VRPPESSGACLTIEGVAGRTVTPRVSDLGQRYPVTEGISGANPSDDPNATPNWGAWYRHINPSGVQGELLMPALDGDTLLVLNRVGKGRTALLLSDQIWP